MACFRLSFSFISPRNTGEVRLGLVMDEIKWTRVEDVHLAKKDF